MGLSTLSSVQPQTPPQSPCVPYEELRNKKLEENKRKLEELNLRHIAATLKIQNTKKQSPAKPLKRKLIDEGPQTPARRSMRLANLPGANYREVTSDVLDGPRARRVYKQRRDLSGRVYASDEAREYAQTEAEKLEAKLDPVFPSFVKPMLQSHTTGGFWLGLPNRFCNQHLPKRDGMITLINEEEEEFDCVYLPNKKGLSGGWRGFSLHHELVDGDALVFHLIKPTAFKVYIIRCSSYNDSEQISVSEPEQDPQEDGWGKA